MKLLSIEKSNHMIFVKILMMHLICFHDEAGQMLWETA